MVNAMVNAMLKHTLMLVICLLLAGCVDKPIGEFIAEDPERDELNSRLSLETLYALSWADDTLTFWVKSTGCTYRQHFSLNVIHKEVTVIRSQQDYCRAMPTLKRIQIDAKLPKKWLLKNPLEPAPNYMQDSPVLLEK